MRLPSWFRSPRPVFSAFLAVAVVSALALGGLAWQLLKQDGDLETQRRQVQLEQSADALVAAMRDALVDLQTHIGAESARRGPMPADVVAISITSDGVITAPPGRLAFLPSRSPGSASSSTDFAEGERFEVVADNVPATTNVTAATNVYKRLAAAGDVGIRGGALMRLARTYRKHGAYEQALEAYAALAELDATVIDELPASLIARLGRIRVFEQASRRNEAVAEASRLSEDLRVARWRLTRAQYETYTKLARESVASPRDDDHDAVTRAEAASWLWERRDVDSPLTRRSLSLASGIALVVWRSTAGRLDGLIAGRAYIASIAAGAVGSSARWAISDPEGRAMVSEPPRTGPAANRAALTSGLPWTVHVFPEADSVLPPSPRRQMLLLALTLVTLVLGAGWYFIFRSLSRERQVAQLQSDFVAAVSHEFRSPLTALTQAADLLAHDRLPSDSMRRQTYDVLVRDTSRLRSLVEGLLEFGRLEAGATVFRFEHLDIGELVESTLVEFQNHVAADGYVVDLFGQRRGLYVRSDREAVTRALWNLLDNAVKYSPESRSIRVEMSQDAGRVSIGVHDQGIGIPADEQRAIFDRFVRGGESKRRRIRGTGIGLAMVRQIAVAHGGDVGVVSEPGRGSVFTFRLPIQETGS